MYKTAIVLNDFHIPYHDKKIYKLIKDFVKAFEPDEIYLNGDIFDMWEISSFDKNPLQGIGIKKEIELGRKLIEELVDGIPKSVWIYGNHEFRFERFIVRNAKELIGLTGMSLKEQVNLPIDVVSNNGKENYIDLGPILIGHFEKANKYSAYTAKNLLDAYGKSLIQGHTHRGGSHFRTKMGRTEVAYENFCLCSLNPLYMISPDWSHGFSILRYTKNWFHVEQIPIINYQFVYDDEIWRVK